MYKKLLIAMSVLALAACQKNKLVQSNPGNAISFQAVTNYAKTGTRAAAGATILNEVTSTNLPSFNVTAINNGGKHTTQNYFTDLIVKAPTQPTSTGSYNNGNTAPGTTIWNNSKTYFWPGNDLDFYAYNNDALSGSGSPAVSINNAGKTITGFVPAGNAQDQKDLVIATDIKRKEIATVPLMFQHALSEITVNARSGNSAYDVKVLGVKIVGLNNKGTFTFPTETSSNLLESGWVNSFDAASPAPYYSTKSAGTAVTLTGSDVNDATGSPNPAFQRVMGQADGASYNFMVLPQTGDAASVESSDNNLQNNGAYLALLIQIIKKDGSQSTQMYPDQDGKYAYSCVPLTTVTKTIDKTSTGLTYTFKPGMRYTFNITFFGKGKGAGYIEPLPSNEDTKPGSKNGNNPGGDNHDPNKTSVIPSNPGNTPDSTPESGKKPGDPIVNDPILFSVTVQAWKDASEINIDL